MRTRGPESWPAGPPGEAQEQEAGDDSRGRGRRHSGPPGMKVRPWRSRALQVESQGEATEGAAEVPQQRKKPGLRS